ncbi:MAG: LCP family glycopolymer transferase [Candidatus Promineifilaceae bacterium]
MKLVFRRSSLHTFGIGLALALIVLTGCISQNSPLATATLVNTAAPVQATESEVASTETISLPATNTPVSTEVSGTATRRPTSTQPKATATATLPPTITPTAVPLSDPTLTYLLPPITEEGEGTPTAAPFPSPVPIFQTPEEITNILLMGTDEGGTNTDTMIVVSINRETKTASMLSLPRDLYVYIPEVAQMGRINTAFVGGIDRVKQTILYNFGIPIHYYAKVDFSGFKKAVDLLGGVDVAVSCQLRDWRLKSPELDPTIEENWEQFTLEPGVHHMDGDMALWYVRSRRTTSDFDRGRRQQQILRSMLNQGVDLGLVPQLPELWNTYRDSVVTDLDVGRLLQLATMASGVKQNGVQHLYIVGEQVRSYVVPASGANVQLPVWDKVQTTVQRLFLPPALNKATRPPIAVEIVDGTGLPDKAILAAENLAWYDFEPVMTGTTEPRETTTIQYFAENTKGSFDWLLSWIFDKRTSDVELVTGTPYPYNYRVVLGQDYQTCRPQLFAPQAFLEQ